MSLLEKFDAATGKNSNLVQKFDAAYKQKEQEKAAKSYVANTVPLSSDYLKLINNLSGIARETDPLMGLAMETVSSNGYVSMADLNRESNGAGTEVQRKAPVDLGMPAIIAPKDMTPTMPHHSGKFDEPSTLGWRYGEIADDAQRYAAAMTPTSDMYLNPYTADAASFMQSEADKALADAAYYREKENSENKALEDQRKTTNQAFRAVDTFTPLESGAWINSPEQYDTAQKMYDQAAAEDAKLKAMGGRAARELPLTVPKNFFTGVVGAARGLVSEAGYIAQGATKAQMDENAEMWRRMGREDYARDMEKARDAQGDMQNWAQFGQPYISSVSEETAGYGKGGQILGNVAQGVGGMVPSILSNLAVPGSGLPVMFFQASGNATEEAKAAGASDEAAALYGTAVGAVEVLTEKMFGGIPGLNIGALDEGIENIIKQKVGNEAAQRAIMFLVDALGEGVEEFTSEFGDYFLDKWLVKHDDRSLNEVGKDALYSFLIGALTSVAMQAPAEVVNMAKTRRGREQLAQIVADQVEQQIEQPDAAQNATQPAVNEPLMQLAQEMATEQITAARDAELRAQEAAQAQAAMTAQNAQTIQTAIPAEQTAPAAEIQPQNAPAAAQETSERQTAPAAQAEKTPVQAQKKPAVRANNPAFVQDAVSDRAKLTYTQKRALDTIGKVLGVRVRMVESISATDADGNVRQSGAQGYYKNGEIVLARDADDPYLTTAVHESVHRIRELSEGDYSYLAGFVQRNMSDPKYKLAELIKGMEGYTAENIPEEIVADAFGRMLGDEQTMRQFVAENSTAAQRIMDVFAEIFDRIRQTLTGGNVKTLTDNQRKVYEDLAGRLDVMMKYYQDAVANAQESKAYETNGGKAAPKDVSTDFAEAKYSVAPPYRPNSAALENWVKEMSDEASETYSLFNDVNQIGGDVSRRFMLPSEWNEKIRTDKAFAETARKIAERVPENIRKNAHINEDGTITETAFEKEFRMERSMMQRLVDSLPMETIPSTVESNGKRIRISEKGKVNTVGGEAYRRALLDERRKMYREGRLPTKSISGLSKDTWGAMGFLATNGKTGASGDFTTLCPQMYYNKGCFYCYRRAALTTGVNNKLVGENVWYTGEVLQLKQDDIDGLNKNGGLRIQSFGDWMEQYSSQLADLLMDAEEVGLQVKIITKEPSLIDTVALLRNQGIGKNLYFNLSTDYTIEEQGAINNQNGDGAQPRNPFRPYMTQEDGRTFWKRALSVEEANEYRKKYPWVNTRIVATTVDEFLEGLRSPMVDVVTGYHGNIRQFERVSSATGETLLQVEALGDAGMPRFAFNQKTGQWTLEYEGKTATHKKLAKAIEDAGLQMQYYIKSCCITGRCATCEGKCGKVARDFNVKNATNADKQSVAYWQKHMTSAEDNPLLLDQMEDAQAKALLNAELERRKYSRSDRDSTEAVMAKRDADYSAAVESGNMETAQRMVDEAAKAWGAETGKNGKPLVLYHGTPAFGFTKFSTDAIFTTPDRGVAEGYGGGKGYADARRISETYIPDDGTDETLIRNVKNILHQDAHKATQADLDRVKAEISKKANELSSAAADAWDYGNGFPEMPSDVENGLQYLLTLPGEIAETIDELFTGDYPASEIQSTINGINKYREATRNWFAEHRSEIKAAGNEDLYRMVMGFDLTDFAIDAEYTLLPALDSDNYLVGESGGFASKEGLRDRVEQAKDLGAYSLYGDLGNNPLVIDAKGAFWASVHAPMFGENTMLTDDIVRKAKAAGYTSLVIKNVMDPAMNNYSPNRAADDYIFFTPDSVKSADPVTYDDNGNVIPLSERFNPENEDIRYSTSDRELLDEYIKAHGAIKTGENPTRDITMPKRTTPKTKMSMTVRTVAEAGATPEEFIPTIENLAANHEFDYTPYSDKKAIADADRAAATKGWQTALTDWVKDVSRGEVSKRNTALGWALYNNAVNAGDTETALLVLRNIVQHQRNAAQAVQATRILKQLNPETQLYNAERTVESLNDELKKRYGDKAPDLEIDPDLAERFLNARSKEGRDKAMKDIYRDIGRQMPTRFIDRWNAWRYLAMLGNPRTHIRNIVGNAGFAPVVAAKNLTATAIESAVNLVSGGKIERTKGNVIGRGDLMKAAWNDYANVREEALGEGKYNDSAIAKKEIQDARRIFGSTKSKVWNKTGGAALEWVRKANGTALDAEDVWFSKPHYTMALAQYCAANGISAEQISKGQGLAKARAYAIKEAQKATYRDTNDFSQAISRLGRGAQWSQNKVTRAISTVMEGILPFRKTPANILARGVEYSPIGLLKSLTYDLAQVQNGNMSAADMIDNLSAGLTGTGLVALGAYLVSQGLLRGRGGSDDKKKDFDKLTGHQNYALELPNGTSITLDWLAPEALPLFIGANLAEIAKENNGNMKLADILTAVGNVTEPMLEMSCLQSLNNIFQAVGYAKEGDMNALTSALASAATSYLTQALPTLLGQVERTGEGKRMTTYTDKNDFLTGDIQYTLGKASARLPVWDYHQIPYIDAWGREELTGKPIARGFNNFFNPSFVSKINESDMEKELERLYDSTGENVFPQRAKKYFNVDGERKDLTAGEYLKYATTKGQTSYAVVGGMTSSSIYENMTDAEKTACVEDAYSYANQTARTTVGGKVSDSWVEKAQTGVKHGIAPETYIMLRNITGDIESLKDKNGDTISNSKGLQIMEKIYSIHGLNDEQRQYLFESFGVGKTILHYNKAAVSEKLSQMRKQ